jgi:hypothetical protein
MSTEPEDKMHVFETFSTGINNATYSFKKLTERWKEEDKTSGQINHPELKNQTSKQLKKMDSVKKKEIEDENNNYNAEIMIPQGASKE